MSITKNERELRRLTGLKPQDKEDRQQFLARLAKGTLRVSNAGWDRLPEGAQAWANEALTILNNPRTLPEFGMPKKKARK